MIELKLRSIGNSLGVILPKGVVQHLRIEAGDVVVARETPEGIVIMRKRTLHTLGREGVRKTFRYTGSVRDGVIVLHKTTNRKIPAELFEAALTEFAGREVVGGFNKSEVRRGGFGEWVQMASGERLSPQDASFVAAILCEEAGVTSRHSGNAVILQFPV